MKDMLYDFKRRYRNATVAAECDAHNRIYKMVSGLMFLLICMYVLVPLFELFTAPDAAAKPFPYKMIFPYNANAGPVYGLTYVLTSMAGFGVVSTLFAEDSLFGFYVSHVCGQLQMLHAKIAVLRRRIEAYERRQLAQHEVKRCLDRIIVQQNVIMG